MQEPKYKTPNGQIVEKKELQSKYGAKFDELVKNKTFLEVNEPVYKTPSGKYEVESVLSKKYGEKFNELKTNNTFVLDTPVKKKESSQSPSVQPKSGSVPKTGSSGSPKFKLAGEKEKINPNVNYDNYDLEQNSAAVEKTEPKSKNKIIANTAYTYAINNVDKSLSEQRYKDEVDNYQFFDGVKQGMKNTFNTFIGNPLIKLNESLGGNKDFKISQYKPLESELKQAKKELFDERGDNKSTEEEIKERAKKIFIDKDIQEQLHSNIDKALPSGYDREGIWKELKLEQLRSNDILREKVASSEVFKSKIEEFEEFSKNVNKENPTEQDVEKFNTLKEEALTAVDGLNYLSKNYDKYVDQAKNDKEKLELFKYNYNDLEKNAKLFYSSALNIEGGTLKLLGETAKYVDNELGLEPIAGQMMSDLGSEMMNDAKKTSDPFYRYKATKLNSWSDVGSFATQLTSEQLPILASIYLGGNAGIAATSMSSGGQKINDLEEQAKQPFGRVYSDGEKLATGWLYAGAEFFPEKIGTARILKDLERTVSSASTASRKLFRDSFMKQTTDGVKKLAYYSGLEGSTELVTAQGQITIDEELLNIVKTDAENNEQRMESFFSGAIMGGGMSVVGGGLGFVTAQAKLYSDAKDVKEVKSILSNVQGIQNEIETNVLLTDKERTELYQEMNVLTNQAFETIAKNANKATEFSVEEKSALLDINLRQAELKSKYQEIADSNFSKEIKNKKVQELKSEYNSLEEKRSAILKGEFNTTKQDALQQEATITEVEQEAQPQAEVQETEQEAITKEDIEVRRKETESKIKRKELFSDGGTFSNILGESGVDSVPTRHTETNGIEFVEFSNPNTGIVDVVMSGTSSNDYVGFYRIYENGKPTEKWSSNLKNKSRNKENFKTMIGGVQSMLPKGHQYTEKTSISTDGLRIWEQQLNRGYELQYDNNGNLITNEVAINGDAIVNELGIDVNQGNFDNISVTNRQQFESVKKALLPYLQKLGLNESNIRNVNGTVEIDLPVLRQKTNKEQSNNNQINNADNYLGTPTVTQTEDGDLYEFKTKDGIIAGVMVSPTEFRIDGISANETGKGMGSKMFENLIDHLKNKGVDTITTKSAGEGAVKMHQKAVDKGLLTEVSKNGREATFNINKNESTQGENNVSDGNSRIGVEPMAEVGGIEEQATENTPTESISPTANIGTSETENEVEYVKKEIDRGILNWSGDIGSPRIDLGISWADIRKGESDIRKGNVNTVPAKRLIEAINKAKNESGYRYKQGTGGASMRGQEFVTFEDIQRATNEDSLTDAEINEIIANQNELATEYDEYFNSLDEQTQNEILENYENQPREISEDSQRGESEINVSNEKETAAEPKQEVEKTVLDRILNQDELKDTFDFLDSFKIDPNDLKATLPFLPEVWNAFIEAVKLSVKAGNSMRKTMDIAFDKMKQSGYDLNELTKVYNAFGKKFAENFIPKETKEFVEQIIPETSSQDKSFEFEKMASNFPNTGEVRTYMSGETYEKYTSRTPENDQEINKIKLIDSLKHGVETIQIAIDTFGDNFVSEVLKFAETPTLSIESKALLLISLENELDRQYDAFPEKRKEIQRNLNLVLAKRQALASSASKVMNMNRLKAFAKSGFDINEITDKMFSNSEKESRRKIENAVQSNFDDINKAEEDSELGEDFEVNAPIVKREKSEVKKDISEALKKMKEDLAKIARGGNLSVTIPGYKQLEVATPHILKLAKLYAELGGMTTKEIVSEIFNQISSTFPAIQRKDIANVIRDTQAKKEPKKDKKIKDLVKQALINRGYFREVNKKQKDGTREVVKLLDWKKLAGEEGSVKNIKNKTEEALKDMGYTDSQIQAMQKALLEEYNDLRASIIEKSINDLENRNRIKPVANRKTLAKKLSELYNLGMFENDMDNYENLLNSAIGFNTFQQKQYEELKEYGKALSVLFNFNNGKNKDQKFSELAIKTQAAIITKNIDLILSKSTFSEAPIYFKLASIFQNFMGLSQRMKLVSLKQIVENPWSAKKNLFYQNAGDLFLVKENGDLKANRKKLAKYVYKDIVFNGSNIYGDVTTSLTTQSQVEEWLNKQSDNKLYHMFISGLSGRSFLEGADSSNKVLMTEKIFQRNIIKLIMTGKTDLGKMTEKEAMNWIAERMTGQNLENAQKLAEEVIDKVNTDAGKIILPKTEENIYRFASDIVKESLNQGKALDIDLIQKAYNSAYKSAGFNLGHEANNAISLLAGWGNQQVSAKLDRAIRDKKWLQATTLTLANILTKNIINPFVGGGTNWIVLGAQATGMDPFSIIVDYSNYRDNRIDLTTEEGIKNLENAMVRSSNLRNTTARTFVGAVISIGMAAAFVASGQADDLEDWLKKNEWARKYFKVFSPKAILLVLAYENGSLAFTLSDLLNQKTDNFNTTLKVINSIQSDKSSTSGEIGRAISGPMEVPFVPWRIVKDVQNVHKGLQGVPQYKSDYRVTGFLNGVYQGGLVDYIGLRPEGDFVPESKDSEKVSFPDPSKNLPNPMKGLPNY